MRSRKTSFVICFLLLTALLHPILSYGCGSRSSDVSESGDSAKTILQRHATAWRGRQQVSLNQEILLAFWIKGQGGGEYHLKLGNEPSPQLLDGAPNDYDLGFETDIEFLRRLDRGEINALTAMGQGQSGDPTPLSLKTGTLFGKKPEAELLTRRICFFFWTSSWPPSIRFGNGLTREVHGANGVLLLYEDRFRSAWFQLKPGMHVFPGGWKAPWATLIVVTRGSLTASFDGKVRVISEGDTVFIPSGMSTEYWVEAKQYGELIWIAIGDGA